VVLPMWPPWASTNKIVFALAPRSMVSILENHLGDDQWYEHDGTQVAVLGETKITVAKVKPDRFADMYVPFDLYLVTDVLDLTKKFTAHQCGGDFNAKIDRLTKEIAQLRTRG